VAGLARWKTKFDPFPSGEMSDQTGGADCPGDRLGFRPRIPLKKERRSLWNAFIQPISSRVTTEPLQPDTTLTDDERRPIRFGILGTGRITRRLVADLQSTPGASVTAIASRTSERARWYADSYGIANAVSGYAELIARDDVDAVYVALPPSLHAEWMIASAAAGKHVLCEKPLATTSQATQEMSDACAKARVHWLDATAWLHHDRTDMFRQWLSGATVPQAEADFRLGSLRHVSSAVSFFNPFQSGDHRQDAALGGGCLLDLGWYAAGILRLANDGLPLTVNAQSVMRGGVPYRVTAIMNFPNDVSATMSCAFDTATRKWFEIAGEEASIVCDDFTRPWPDKPARGWVHEASGKVHPFSCECHQEQNMISRLIGWINATEQDEQLWDSPSPPWESYHRQALETQRMLEAMETSMTTGQTVTL
jgi:predicted dehydrogenase